MALALPDVAAMIANDARENLGGLGRENVRSLAGRPRRDQRRDRRTW
jgi:hypothetical protein